MRSRRNIETPNKKLVLQAIKDNPGSSASYLARVSGVPVWATVKILPELAVAGLIYAETDNPQVNRNKRWYPRQKPLGKVFSVTQRIS